MRESEAGASLAAVVRQAAVADDDALLILDDALTAAQESPYEDAERVAAVLDAMALVARRRQAGSLGTSLREAFRELGVEYRGGISANTPARLREQYVIRLGGEVLEATEHVVLGTSYDPHHCLRIYFTSRAPAEPRFVISYVGRHREVMTTSRDLQSRRWPGCDWGTSGPHQPVNPLLDPAIHSDDDFRLRHIYLRVG